ncbi:MAG: thiamine-phosphate kinase [Bacteroidales bacterium]|nr:thiamine-phosphate kinase [Bacteroidales bacterium]
MSKLGEFELIQQIRSSVIVPENIQGIGDDCAVIPQQEGYETLVSTDMLMEGVHFLREDVNPYQLGWKSAAVNFSDIAAMGGEPIGSFLAFSLPKNLSDEWIARFMEGYQAISQQFSFPLLGGDTTSSLDRICICVTVLGKTKKGLSRKRNSAQVGDLVCVTGTLGDSAAGLDVILNKRERKEDEHWLVNRHYHPTPRLFEGIELAKTEGVHAMMDISDGIGSDLRHIIEESQVGINIQVETIPLSPQLRRYCTTNHLDAIQLATCGGEDYELVFTVSPEAEKQITVAHTIIGTVTAGNELNWEGSNKEYLGFRHF